MNERTDSTPSGWPRLAVVVATAVVVVALAEWGSSRRRDSKILPM